MDAEQRWRMLAQDIANAETGSTTVVERDDFEAIVEYRRLLRTKREGIVADEPENISRD